jgi:hypothetical protein
MKKVLIYYRAAIILCVMLAHDATAQRAVSTAGGNGAASTGSVSYTVGLIDYQAASSGQGSVAQGVQHAYDITPLSTEDLSEADRDIRIYPNPVADFLHLELLENQEQGLTYQLYDVNGKLLMQAPINGDLTRIATELLPPSIYFLKVSSPEQPNIKSFKIVKNK